MATNVFINEFHYDNASTDISEFIEIAGVAGTDLTGWSIELYNGSNGTLYDTRSLDGTVIPDLANGFGTIVENYPTNGIQNGAPDGIALVNNGTVVQFLSYEGSFTATNGSANGLTSTDIGVAESGSTPAGFSLQLTGTGTVFEDFVWTAPDDDTPGVVNIGQSFSSDGSTPNLVINEIDADQTSTDSVEFIELYDGGIGNTSLDGLTLVLYNGNNDESYNAIDLDGFSTNLDGFFLLGNPSVANADLVFNNNTLQNGADAVALYQTDATDFPNGTTVTTNNLIDAIVYDTNDADDAGLLVLTPDEPQFNEDENGNKDTESLQRIPNGTGTFIAQAPTPGIENTEVVEPPTLELISNIQGSGTASPLINQTFTVEAIVVGDFQGEDGLGGFYLQEEDADVDGNAATSEGIFVFDGNLPTVDVAVGDKVQVTGIVDESFELTQFTNISNVTVIDSNNTLPTAATINFPLASAEDLETFEGMRVDIPDTLFVTEYFNLDRFGEIRLAADGASNAPGTDGRIDQFTQFNTPDTDAFAAYQAEIAKRQIILDDGSTNQNPDPLIFGRGGQPLSSTNTLRGGDTVEGLSGVLSFGFGNYRIQTNEGVDFQPTNPRPATPEDVGGDLKVASFNVLNFFTTLDVEGNPGSGPNNLEPRGADNQAEFDRQLDKLVTTLATLDADIVGLIELENEFIETNGDGKLAIDTLVDTLNARVGAGTYAYVDPDQSFVDTGDAISVGVIYKTDSVQIAPGTTVAILTDTDLPSLGINNSVPVFDGSSTNRAPLAVTFAEIATGEKFTVAVNHFKSKGGTGTGDNADIGDGQGNFNGTRVRGAEAVNAWLNTDPTGSGDDDFLIIGDLNAYAQEDPITILKNAGYTDLAEEFIGENSYSFVFDGQIGTLDYGLANESLASQITGATEWHINADEPDAIDYNLDFGRNPNLFDGTTPFRTSDHDPLLIGIDLSSPANEITGTNRQDNLIGTEGKDLISGLQQRDTLAGLDGDDILKGGRGSDLLNGGKGNDILVGGRGSDQLTGGEGQDTFVFRKVADRIDRVTDFAIGEDKIDISQILANPNYGSSNPFQDYVSLRQIGNNTFVRIDPNGDEPNSFERTLVILEDVTSTDIRADDFVV